MACVSSLFFKAAFICLLLSASVSSDDLLDSLRFTRDALLGFSPVARGSSSDSEAASGRTSKEDHGKSFRPLNKNLEIKSEIEKAMVNAKAMEGRRIRHREKKYATLTRLFKNSVNSKSYSYARDVLGKLIHLVKTEPSKRKKRRSPVYPVHPGTRFLQRLYGTIGSEKINSFMAQNGEVSLMFVVDDTGSMSNEIEAVKRIAIAVVNYNRTGPVNYILAPFNDPMTGIVNNFSFFIA